MRFNRLAGYKPSLIFLCFFLAAGYALANPLLAFINGGPRVVAALTSVIRVGASRQGLSNAAVQKIGGAVLGLGAAYAGCSSSYLNGCKWSGLAVANDVGQVVDKASNQTPVKLDTGGSVFGYTQGSENDVTVQLSGGAFSSNPTFPVMPQTYTAIASLEPHKYFVLNDGTGVGIYYFRTSSTDANLRMFVSGGVGYHYCGAATQPPNIAQYLSIGDQISGSSVVGPAVTASTYPQMLSRQMNLLSSSETPAKSGCYQTSWGVLYEYRSGTTPNAVPSPAWTYPWVKGETAMAIAPSGAGNGQLDDQLVANMANRVWDYAASKGVIPHRTPAGTITPADVAGVRSAQPASHPTVNDFLGASTSPIDFSRGLEDGASSTPGLDGTGTLPGSGTAVDLGEYTPHSAPTVGEPPVLGVITEPLAHALQNIVPEFPSVQAECPQPSFDISFTGESNHFVLNMHCYWFAHFGFEIALMARLIWMLLALFIFLSA